jgi:hypothetical protein
MIRRFALPVALSLAALPSAYSQVAAPVPARTQLEVIATNGAGSEKHLFSENGRVSMVMARPNQAVPITLQFPTDKAGMPVAASPLDGGRINRDELVILPTGKLIFTFSPGPMPGRYRVMVRTPIEEHLLEFYVVDPAHPPQNRRH